MSQMRNSERKKQTGDNMQGTEDAIICRRRKKKIVGGKKVITFNHGRIK